MKKRSLLCITPLLVIGLITGCKAKKCSVTFNYNYTGAPEPAVIQVEQGKPIAEPTAPSRDGYDFSGWHSDKEGTQLWNFDTAINSDLTLYSAWAPSDVTFDLSETKVGVDKGAEKTVKITLNDKITIDDVNIVWSLEEKEHLEEVRTSQDKLSYTFKGKEISDGEIKNAIKIRVSSKKDETKYKESYVSVTVKRVFDGTVTEDEWKAAVDKIIDDTNTKKNYTATYKRVGGSQTEDIYTLKQDGLNAEFIPATTTSNSSSKHCFDHNENGTYMAIENVNGRDVITGYEEKSLSASTLASLVLLKNSYANFEYDETNQKYKQKSGNSTVKFNKDRYFDNVSIAENAIGFNSYDFTYGDTKVTLPTLDNVREMEEKDNNVLTSKTTVKLEYNGTSNLVQGFTTIDTSKFKDSFDKTKDLKINLLKEDGQACTDLSKISWYANGVQKQVNAEEGIVRINGSEIGETTKLSFLFNAGEDESYSTNYYLNIEYNATPLPDYAKTCTFSIVEGNKVRINAKEDKDDFPETFTIPATIDGEFVENGVKGQAYTVTQIGFGFAKPNTESKKTLRNVVLPNTIESFSDGSTGFTNCRKLKSINLENTKITEIPTNCFYHTDSLTSISFPNTLNKIEHLAFAFSGVKSFHLPSSVNYLSGKFFGVYNITSLTFEDTTKVWEIHETLSTYEDYTPSTDGAVNAQKYSDYLKKSDQRCWNIKNT